MYIRHAVRCGAGRGVAKWYGRRSAYCALFRRCAICKATRGIALEHFALRWAMRRGAGRTAILTYAARATQRQQRGAAPVWRYCVQRHATRHLFEAALSRACKVVTPAYELPLAPPTAAPRRTARRSVPPSHLRPENSSATFSHCLRLDAK